MAKNEGSIDRKKNKLWLRTYRAGGRNKYRTRRQGKKFDVAVRAYCDAWADSDSLDGDTLGRFEDI